MRAPTETVFHNLKITCRDSDVFEVNFRRPGGWSRFGVIFTDYGDAVEFCRP